MKVASETQDMAAEEHDTDQVSVRTYVPAYQRDEWDDHADELDMSRSEFVRSMVQAGRRGFDPRGNGQETGSDEDAEVSPESGEERSRSDPPSDPGESYDDVVVDLLEEECRSWDELVDALTENVEERLDEALERLQTQNEIHYSGKRGGYVLLE